MTKIKQFGFRMICLVFSIFMLAVIINPVVITDSGKSLCSKNIASASLPNISEIFKSLFGKTEKIEKDREPVYVYLGGQPLGFTINCKGVLVIAVSNKSATNIKEGDVITKIQGVEIFSTETIDEVLNLKDFAEKTINLTVKRGESEHQTTITPIFDEIKSRYKLGIWVRDDSAGVGTLTYIRKDNLRFGALGHPVCDIDTGAVMPVRRGNIMKCNIVGIKRGERGNPGELKGLFLRNGSLLGSLDTNNEFGVFGKFSKKQVENYDDAEYEVAYRSEVKNGKAKIRCTIDGCTPKDYDIEIVKTYFQQTKDNKSMFIRITDKELLEKTGGIVQGMSGSPIIQNGKFVGAVTHVFVSDPTKGYGVYADWMINN